MMQRDSTLGDESLKDRLVELGSKKSQLFSVFFVWFFNIRIELNLINN